MRFVKSRRLSVLLVFVLLSPTMMMSGASDTSYEVWNGCYAFSSPDLIETESGVSVEIEGLSNSMDMHSWSVPVKPLKIVVPKDCSVEEVHVDGTPKLCCDVQGEPLRGPVLAPFDGIGTTVDAVECCSDTILFENAGVYRKAGVDILLLNLYPVQYVQGEWYYYEEMNVEVVFASADLNTVAVREDVVLELSTEVENPLYLDTYASSMQKEGDAIALVIITTEEIAANASEELEEYQLYRLAEGIDSSLVTVESIVSNPDYSVNGEWGDGNASNPFYGGPLNGDPEMFNDAAAMIRNFLREAYTWWHSEYVLLIGDADGYESAEVLIPVRGLYATEEGLPLSDQRPLDFEEDDIPSDLYYANLDGCFNSDGDAHFGENRTQNNISDVDEADLYSELSVGRWPVDDAEELKTIIEKTLRYEQSEELYRSKVLFVGEYLGFPGVSAYGGNYMDELIPIIPEDYIVDTLYERNRSWNAQDMIDLLSYATPHIVNHLGHGNQNYALKMYNDNILALSNEDLFFIYSQTCLAGSFDNYHPWMGYLVEDSAAEHFVVEQEAGAFAVIMNARFGLGSEDTLISPSQVVHESFLKALFEESIRALGKANQYAKEAHAYHVDENGIRWVMYETNLIGDPCVQIHDALEVDIEVELQVGAPVAGGVYLNGQKFLQLPFGNSAVVLGGLSISAIAETDPAGYMYNVEFYLNDEYIGSDAEAPYEFSYVEKYFGQQVLKVIAYSEFGDAVETEIPLWLFCLNSE